jgi:hypothetical protein
VKTTLTLATVAQLFLGLGPAALAQNLFLTGGFDAPAGNVFLLTNSSPALKTVFAMDGVSTAVANDNYVRAADDAHPAAESLHLIYLDNNWYASPSLNGVCLAFATVGRQADQVPFHAGTEVIYGIPGQLGASAGDTVAHYMLPNLNDFILSMSPRDDPAGWLTGSLPR